MKKNVFTIILVLLSFNNFSQSSDGEITKRIVDEVMTNSTAYSNLKKLCKQVGPRLSGSANYLKAVDLTQQMLSNIGVDTVFLQPCMVPHWIRGSREQGEIVLTAGKKYRLHLTALGNSIATVPAGISAPVIEVRSMSELTTLGEVNVKGKIIFFKFQNESYLYPGFQGI